MRHDPISKAERIAIRITASITAVAALGFAAALFAA